MLPLRCCSYSARSRICRLYNLDFDGAQKDFTAWQRLHPDDPVGPVSEAAGFLFSEFNRLGVFESQFYENDTAFVRAP